MPRIFQGLPWVKRRQARETRTQVAGSHPSIPSCFELPHHLFRNLSKCGLLHLGSDEGSQGIISEEMPLGPYSSPVRPRLHFSRLLIASRACDTPEMLSWRTGEVSDPLGIPEMLLLFLRWKSLWRRPLCRPSYRTTQAHTVRCTAG